MDKQTFFNLLDKYRDGTASDAERSLVEDYYRRLEIAGATELSHEEEAALRETIYAQVLSGIKKERGRVIPFKQKVLRWTTAAAVLLIVFGAAAYYLFFNTKHTDPATPAVVKQPAKDLPPGRNAAILTLADGKTIVLDSSSGTISKQGGVTIINMSGLLSYETAEASAKAVDKASADQPLFNTVTTARGNQYQLVLADGSKVWLNSASSLRFPAVFTGATREVELNGEGYFEIAPSTSLRTGAKMPFIVNIGGHEGGRVEVLGTHFNVNCYDDEETVKTTLLEGKVKTSMLNGQWSILKPGQQAVIHHSQLTIHNDIDIDQVMAWKNGWFEFDKTDLKTIMRQISRWYDVDIVYAKACCGNEKFGGRIGRNLNLSNILKVLESQDVHCRLEGKKLIVN